MAPSGPPPVVSESERVAAIANAECMRKHGVPNFPDPTFSRRTVQCWAWRRQPPVAGVQAGRRRVRGCRGQHLFIGP